jgi:hypothetical protein
VKENCDWELGDKKGERSKRGMNENKRREN